MKQKTLFISVFMICGFTYRSLAHNNTAALNTDAVKKYGLTIGATYSAHMYGGNFKLDYLPDNKFSLGLRGIVSTFSFSDFAYYPSEKFSTGINILSDLTLTWHISGNSGGHNKFLYSEIGGGKNGESTKLKQLYAEIGIGYLMQQANYTAQFWPISSFTVHENSYGLGAHFTLGRSYKLGPGIINFEGIAGTMLYGKFKHSEIYPADYQLDANGLGHPNLGGNYGKSGTGLGYKGIGYQFLALNIGYTLFF